MDKPIEHYQDLRLNELKKALEANNFGVYIEIIDIPAGPDDYSVCTSRDRELPASRGSSV